MWCVWCDSTQRQKYSNIKLIQQTYVKKLFFKFRNVFSATSNSLTFEKLERYSWPEWGRVEGESPFLKPVLMFSFSSANTVLMAMSKKAHQSNRVRIAKLFTGHALKMYTTISEIIGSFSRCEKGVNGRLGRRIPEFATAALQHSKGGVFKRSMCNTNKTTFSSSKHKSTHSPLQDTARIFICCDFLINKNSTQHKKWKKMLTNRGSSSIPLVRIWALIFNQHGTLCSSYWCGR